MLDPYVILLERIKDIGKLDAINALLEWDQDTFMPRQGVECRSEELALVAALAHDRRTSREMGDLLGQLSNADSSDCVRMTNIRETARLYKRAVNIPITLVKEIAKTSSLAKDAWVKARQEDNFDLFAPLFAKLVELKKQQAEAIGYETEPYDALVDEYEPGASTARVAELFSELRDRLVPLVKSIGNSTNRPDSGILKRHYPIEAQRKLVRRIAEEMGFSFERGRIDVSAHPFCTSMGPNDVRFTTRYDEYFFPAAFFGAMHETGHALYEMGLAQEHAFTPMGTFCSLGIHESQSRMWENMVGRSPAFWSKYYPLVQSTFPDTLRDVSEAGFYAAVNTVAPSLIRVEADEVTYNLHIIVRFEVERDLFNGLLDIADVPSAWNEKMENLVGLRPPNNVQGCLQDIHWAMGIFGYFPTYALGNLYAAQLFAKADEDLGGLNRQIAAGNMSTLLDWLRTHVHSHGRRYSADELCKQATGKPLAIQPFLDYCTDKFGSIYGIE